MTLRAATGVDGGVLGTIVWGIVGGFGANENPEPNLGTNSTALKFNPPNFNVFDETVELSSSCSYQLAEDSAIG